MVFAPLNPSLMTSSYPQVPHTSSTFVCWNGNAHGVVYARLFTQPFSSAGLLVCVPWRTHYPQTLSLVHSAPCTPASRALPPSCVSSMYSSLSSSWVPPLLTSPHSYHVFRSSGVSRNGGYYFFLRLRTGGAGCLCYT